jgi:hypothetical protein
VRLTWDIMRRQDNRMSEHRGIYRVLKWMGRRNVFAMALASTIANILTAIVIGVALGLARLVNHGSSAADSP